MSTMKINQLHLKRKFLKMAKDVPSFDCDNRHYGQFLNSLKSTKGQITKLQNLE